MSRLRKLKIKTQRRRVGLGFDSHAYAKNGKLVLGGLSIPGLPALKGHSDGDVVLHSIIDALLGAAGLGDIGQMFPDTAKKTKGMSSVIMLKRALGRLDKKKLKPAYIDVVIVAEKPKISKIKTKLKKALSKNVGLPASKINIKGKRPEGLRLFGRTGGIAVWAVTSLV